MVKKAYRQDPPNAVQIELAEGCNLYCGFCGLQGIREKKVKNFKFMDVETLRSAVGQMVALDWNPRIEFAMHGEPTMHPEFVEMVRAVRKAAPTYHIMMTSNGGGLLKDTGKTVMALFDAGLNVLALDDYNDANIVPKIRSKLEGKPQGWDEADIKVYEYPQQSDGNPHSRRKPNDRLLVFIEAIDFAEKGNHSMLNNHAGAAAPLNDKGEGKRCAKPFRELSIRWDGNVAICCNDWRGTYKCGNVVSDGLNKVWNGAAMDAARRKLILGERDFGPCKGCDATSYRVGLLPDKFGKVKMAKPDATSAKAIVAACKGKPYTAPVLRPWETER